MDNEVYAPASRNGRTSMPPVPKVLNPIQELQHRNVHHRLLEKVLEKGVMLEKGVSEKGVTVKKSEKE